MSAADAARVVVAVPTRGRPRMLAALLASLDRLALEDGGPSVEIVVVDNDPAASAAPVCARYRGGGGRFPLTRLEEARPGVVHVRNTAAAWAFARADRVAWVDDDEEVTPGWLSALLAVERRFGADAVAGPVVARFEAPRSPWAGEGLLDSPRHRTGAQIRTARAGNLLLTRRGAERAGAPLFDPGLALSGGEDHELLARVLAGGGVVVWADEALVVETVPRSRQTLGWILGRFAHYGTVNAGLALTARPGALTRGGIAAEAVLVAAAGAARTLRGLPRGRAAVVRGLRQVAYGVGLVRGLAGARSASYRATDGG
ncbi:MAG: glycosyltransferase [Myxococcales bacterium]|nr:glycosyltransferase [Myxococcales bacterium]